MRLLPLTRMLLVGLALALFTVTAGCDREHSLQVIQTSITTDEVAALRTTSESGEVLFFREFKAWNRRTKGREHNHFGQAGSSSHRHDITAPVDESSVRQLIETVLFMEATGVDGASAYGANADVTVDLFRAGDDQPSISLRIYAKSTPSGAEYRARIDGRDEVYVVPVPEIEGVFEVIRRTENLEHGH